MNLLVTGGNGYIGSHMCKFLSNQGHKVYIIDNHSSSPLERTHDFGTFYKIDIGDADELRNFFIHHDIECVFHFSSKINVGDSESDPGFYYQENVAKSINLLSVMVECGVKNLIFSSTCAIFGDNEKPLHEELPKNPVSTYAKTKHIIEQVIEDLANKNKLNAICFRYFNAAGCSPDGDIGENHEPETHLIPKLVQLYLSEDLDMFQIYGDNYNTHDGTCVRDYIHVDDLVDAHYRGYQLMGGMGKNFNCFNLGSEKGYSVLEVIKAFEKVTKQKVPLNFSPPRDGDVPCLVADSAKAEISLSFATNKGIIDCIEDTLRYQKKRFNK